ncbi:MAG: glucose 1-dehydrogenase [Deltaproteobacteria bacterium]|nr:glucose 1-dehydrogenase [Deltaproteobacteria bacterium]MBW2124018.1 glucose 1-dehydrogenase [Deltaproteobacteria bacterium]
MGDLDKIAALAPSTLDRFRLDTRKALVVGGNKGLGQAMAMALGAAGADVCVVGRGPDGLKETAEALRRLGRKGMSIAADVTIEAQVEQLVGEVVEAYGGIDILVNSQGGVHLEPISEFDAGQWQRVIDINLKSVFLCCKHVGRVMLAQGKGKIINISSVRGFQGRAEDAAYAPSKGGVNQLTHSLAIEWGVKGINVNAIAPVFTRTAISAPFLDDPVKRDWVLSRIPMKRTGELDDLFGPVVFLASDASDFVNGHVLVVDGGWLAA